MPRFSPRFHLVLPLFTAIFALTLPACASDAWLEDFAAAKAQAEKEHKDLLLDFTGSDWCPACVRLHREVLNVDAFQRAAQQHFVLVELDYPRATAQLAATRLQNETLRRKFAVDTYPSIFLTDAHGRPYARTGYAAGGPELYAEALEKLRAQKEARDAALGKAEQATGIARARLLDEALSGLMAKDVRVGYDDLMQEIQKLDSDNGAGLKKKYEIVMKYNDVLSSTNDEDMDGMLVKADALLKETNAALTGENRQVLLFLKANVLASRRDMPNAIQMLLQAKAAAPETERARLIEQILLRMTMQQGK